MPKFNIGGLLEGTAYGVLNEILAEFHSDDGFALPSRYEVVILPPQGTRGKPKGALNNVFSQVMQENTGEGITRKVGLQCESIDFPGRNLDTAPDTNIYGPTREIVQGYSYAEISATFRMSSDYKEALKLPFPKHPLQLLRLEFLYIFYLKSFFNLNFEIDNENHFLPMDSNLESANE